MYEEYLDGSIYKKTITAAALSLPTTLTEIAKFSLTSNEEGIIEAIAASNDAVLVDILINGSSVGAKYGIPVDCRALPTNQTPVKLLIPIPVGATVTIQGRGATATTTLNALRIDVIVKKK